MRKFTSLIIILLSVVSVNAQYELADSAKQQILNEHNFYRKIVGAPPLSWSDTVELYARQQVERIIQNPNDYEITPYYGINIYRSPQNPTPAKIVNYWAKEQRYYHGEVITEDNVKQFGHYTQIIWKQTFSLGCAIGETKGGVYVVVCLYNPKGNRIGNKP